MESFLIILEKKSMKNRFNKVNVVSKLFEMKMRISLETFIFCYRCHQTDKPYKCNSCYKCFINEEALLEHIPKHKESKHLKTHICQFCGKSYTQETYLAKHMQKHTDRYYPISVNHHSV